MSETNVSVAGLLKDFALRFDQEFQLLLDRRTKTPPALADAVRYSALAPGKRLRPFLLVRCCEICGGTAESAFPAAAAVECVHAFSLVHDDLPAMDNDDLRRGRPTCHRQFGEALAILAGDALLVLAFECLTEQVQDPGITARLCAELAFATGASGMIGGQAEDILGESQPPDHGRTESIHRRKTAALIRAACRMGAQAARAGGERVDALGRYGEKLGLAFQIADDLLDVLGKEADLGKAAGKDARKAKQTYPRSVGIEKSREIANSLAAAASAELDRFGREAADLRDLAGYVVERAC
jgi:geranylgeranyl diphosphate synthase type II